MCVYLGEKTVAEGVDNLFPELLCDDLVLPQLGDQDTVGAVLHDGHQGAGARQLILAGYTPSGQSETASATTSCTIYN